MGQNLLVSDLRRLSACQKDIDWFKLYYPKGTIISRHLFKASIQHKKGTENIMWFAHTLNNIVMTVFPLVYRRTRGNKRWSAFSQLRTSIKSCQEIISICQTIDVMYRLDKKLVKMEMPLKVKDIISDWMDSESHYLLLDSRFDMLIRNIVKIISLGYNKKDMTKFAGKFNRNIKRRGLYIITKFWSVILRENKK